jgi:hypothetical protein
MRLTFQTSKSKNKRLTFQTSKSKNKRLTFQTSKSKNKRLTFQTSKNKNMSFQHISQQKTLKIAQQSYKFTRPSEEEINKLPPTYLIILNIIIRYCQQFDVVYVSQQTIADEAATAREVVNRAFKSFEEKGWITMDYRHMKTSIYHISPYFNFPDVRHRLGHLIPVLKSFLISCILSNFALAQAKPEVTLLKNSNVYIYKNSHSTKRIGDQTMKSPELNPISPTIREIKSINLTKWGQIELSIFSDKAIEYADRSYKYTTNVRDPFRFFFKLAYNYSLDNNIKPNYTYRNQLATLFKMPENPKLILTGRDKASRTETCDKTSRVVEKKTVTVTKGSRFEEIRAKERAEKERYEKSIAHIKVKTLSHTEKDHESAKAFQRMMGLPEVGCV